MERVEAISDASDNAPLADDVLKLVREVATWAAERPIVSNVTLFGERLRAGYRDHTAVQIAVAYDEQRMVDGFDDWIEQLRTNFADLSAQLGQQVTVFTPECADWETVVRGSKLPAMSQGKVQLSLADIPLPAGKPDRRLEPRSNLGFFKSWMSFATEPLPSSGY